jgi:hypothetical protein
MLDYAIAKGQGGVYLRLSLSEAEKPLISLRDATPHQKIACPVGEPVIHR